MKSYMYLLCGLLMLGCTSSSSPVQLQNRPNLILIMTDDQGYGDFGFMGNSYIQTPNIDDLARKSAMMERFYVSPVCAPTRACLMTGRYNYRTRVVDTWIGRAQMEPDEKTIAEYLREAGYNTGLFGKWHLGDCYPMRPQDQGFEEVLMHRGGGLAQPSEPIENQRRYTDAILWHNGQQIQSEGYCADTYFEYAQNFIRRSAATAKPFFSYIATNTPHGPFHDVPESLRQKYAAMDLSPLFRGEVRDSAATQDRLARIFAMIENVDQNVGRLQILLNELGIADNTLILFMVDNGPNSRRYVRELRGMKGEVHEGGIRSPLWAYWPGKFKAGQRSDRIAAHIDLLPTLLDAAGLGIPEGSGLDGRSILPLLRGEKGDWPERHLFIQSHRGDEPTARANFAVIGQEYKLLHNTGFGNQHQPFDSVAYELYQLSKDPAEAHNLADTLPEIRDAMLTAYDDWFQAVSQTRPDNYAKPRIVMGTDAETETALTWQDWEQSLPGDGWGKQGFWRVNLPEAGKFAVEVIARDTLENWTFRMEIGEQLWSAEAPGISRKLYLPEVPVEAGDWTIRGYVEAIDKEVMGPYQLIFSRL